MPIEIVRQPVESLTDYGSVPISYTVDSRYRVERVGLGWKLTEEPVEPPYVKDYDDTEDQRPVRWLRRWDISNWAVFAALDDGVRIGGAVVAWNTTDVDMLEGRDDLAVLWDLRIRPERRGQGIGSRLFAHAVRWARERGCSQLKIETQNFNVRACKFYAARGCHLGGVHPNAYREYPNEVQLLWYLEL